MSQQWSLYPNRYVAALASESMEVLVPHVHLSLNPILAKLEGGRYVGPIIPKSLEYLVHETGSRGGSGGSIGGSSDSGGATSKKRKASPTGDARMWVRYDAHLPALSLWDRENSCYILVGTVLQTLHAAVLCKNWHLCRSCWEDCERHRSHVPTPPEVATTVAGLLKAARGE